jgi:hypothetical protein
MLDNNSSSIWTAPTWAVATEQGCWTVCIGVQDEGLVAAAGRSTVGVREAFALEDTRLCRQGIPCRSVGVVYMLCLSNAVHERQQQE